MHYYIWNIGDWRKSTRGLSHLEKGLYREMIDELCESEQPLPKDEENLFDLLGVSKPAEEAAVRRVLAKKWVEFEGGWIQPRAWAEVLNFKEKQQRRAESGRLGGLAKHQRLLSRCLAGAKQSLATLGASSQEPVTSSQEPVTSAASHAAGAEGVHSSPEVPEGIEFPTGWPETVAKAVGHVRSLMLPVPPHGPPHEDWVSDVWLQAVGRGFCDGNQVQIVRFAHWVHSRWSKEGASWLSKRAAGSSAEKKERGAAGSMGIEPPDFPWRTLVEAEEGYVPTVSWELQTARKRKALCVLWAGLTPERQAELRAMPEPEADRA